MRIKPVKTHGCRSYQILSALIAPLLLMSRLSAMEPKSVTFQDRISEHKWPLHELDRDLTTDFSAYEYLVLEMRTVTPQRFALWLYTADGPRRIMLQPFGQNVWLRASIPLKYFKGRDQFGQDMASANNRRTEAFWVSTWGPFGSIDKVQALGVTMIYPINRPRLEIRSIRLTTEDVGSDFLEKKPVLGRMDGENYNIGLVDVTNRPYPELAQALKATHKVLYDVHTGKVNPFSQRPMASEAGTPRPPWD